MKKIIVSEHDLKEFLSYCVSWNFNATCINKVFPFQGSPWKFIFRLNRPLTEIDFKNLKNNAPSMDSYKI